MARWRRHSTDAADLPRVSVAAPQSARTHRRATTGDEAVSAVPQQGKRSQSLHRKLTSDVASSSTYGAKARTAHDLDLQPQCSEQCGAVKPQVAVPVAWKRPGRIACDNITKESDANCKASSAAVLPTLSGRVESFAPQAPQDQTPSLRGRRKAQIHDGSPDSAQLLSKVLHQMIPLHEPMANTESKFEDPAVQHFDTGVAPKESSPGIWDPKSPELRKISRTSQSTQDSGGGSGDAAADVIAFRNALSKSFGSLTRGFRAMKNVASLNGKCGSPGAASSSCRLTCAEFEWCVSAYLHYGDRRLARRIFFELDRTNRGDIGLMELAQQPRSKGLLSLVEFRRLLLERHVSLAHAFRELEEYLDTSQTEVPLHGLRRTEARRGTVCARSRSVPLTDFIEATAFFGLDAHQATHFFRVIDANGDGDLTFSEFLDALTHMPRNVLLHDLRQRILLHYPSVSHAFRDLPVSHGNLGNFSGGSSPAQAALTRLDFKSFSAALARLGIVEAESAEIFRIVDEDSSGDVSLEELREAMRDVAPTASLEEFWQRFAAEWPEILKVAQEGGDKARRNAGTLILELLPQDLKAKYTLAPSPQISRSRPAVGTESMRPSASSLAVVTHEVFDALSTILDISCANARDIFHQILSAAALRRKPTTSENSRKEHQDESVGPTSSLSSTSFGLEKEIHIEDFLDQLQLWTQNPLTGTGNSCQRSFGQSMVQQMVAPTKAAITALKAELAPQRPALRPHETAHVGCRRQSQKLPKLPWQSFSTPRQ